MNQEELLNTINQKLHEQFHGSIEKAEVLYDFPVFTINKEKIHEVLAFLKQDADLNFHFLTDLTGVQTEDEKHLGAIYHLHNMQKNYRIRVKTFFPINHPEIPTATNLWDGANWMERETYDNFGIKFTGHPNLKRILNVDEMDIFPMRKEYPMEDQTREDKDNKMFGR
ncbi:MAG: NADH-quinone oxidoreductase subunit C [Bacteroidetes bacterium]|nr:NADH-quinone oxidoreductase subunit C [Bacteroidota bacterium]